MSYTTNKLLRPLSEERTQVSQRAKDADWSGKTELASRLFAQVEEIDARLLAGETYEVLF